MAGVLDSLSDRELGILNRIRRRGPATKAELMQTENLTLSTLSRSMRRLEERGLLREKGVSDSSGGRRPVEYDVAPDGGFCVGVDISRTCVRLVLLDLAVRVRGRAEFSMESQIGPRECVERVAELVGRMTQALPAGGGRIWGIGVGTVGPMDRASGRLLSPQGFPAPGWDETLPLGEWLRARTGLPCEVDNGANTAALAEFRFGSGRGGRSLAYIHCGVGIRSAVIRDDRIIRTMNNREDALGHMTVDIHGAPCACGGRGCLEGYASLEAVRADYAARTGQSDDFAGILRRAGAGEAPARGALRAAGEALGVGVSNLVRLLGPERIILSGPLPARYPPFFEACVEAFRRQNRPQSGPEFLRGGAFGEDAAAVGAGLLPAETLLGRRGMRL